LSPEVDYLKPALIANREKIFKKIIYIKNKLIKGEKTVCVRWASTDTSTTI